MRKSMMVLLAASALAGCGPTFSDPVDEYRYLKAQANLTPSQWRRMQEVGEMRTGLATAPDGHAETTSVREAAEALDMFDMADRAR